MLGIPIPLTSQMQCSYADLQLRWEPFARNTGTLAAVCPEMMGSVHARSHLFHAFIYKKNLRLYLPRRVLTPSNTSFGNDDYCELSSKFKAAHVKTICWFIAFKLGELSKGSAPHSKPASVWFFPLTVLSILRRGAERERWYSPLRNCGPGRLLVAHGSHLQLGFG